MDSIRNLFGSRMTSEKTSPQNNENFEEDKINIKNNANYTYSRDRTISETSSCSMNSGTEPAAHQSNTKSHRKDSEPFFWIMWRS